MKKAIFLLMVIILISGCATTSSVTPKLSLGMTKEQVLAKCGEPVQAGAVQGKDGEVLESFMYKEIPFIHDGNAQPIITYVYFIDGKVVYYGSNPNMPTKNKE